ncbi:hypothetical protein N7528_006565 [Penicillium herquei]|nr:hypothetical protein N7528_006565 [Penicillium herquei]
MAPCSRGALSRAIQLGSLRCNYKPRLSRLIVTNTTLPRITPARSRFVTSIATHAQNPCRSFSTSRVQCEQSVSEELANILPTCCPGCGAFTQTIEPQEPGYYSQTRKQSRKLLALRRSETEKEIASSIATTENIAEDGEVQSITELSVPKPSQDVALPDNVTSPSLGASESEIRATHVCDRCHDLIHHNQAVSAPKPSIVSIREYLSESPYKNNRVYHILDAADFPMSLVPRIHEALSAMEQRSRNRRSATEKYSHGRKLPTVSFIITRSDLLAATKDQVDSKMEYFRTVLREALGRSGKDVRMGNVHMISAHRGWWTKQVKEEIAEHGGGIWVVGKANVGKSSFIEACFPKDSRRLETMAEWTEQQLERELMNQQQEVVPEVLDPDSLLPPAPREGLYPVLPVVSSMPGTTVSPIRIPFGRGKGEMIDLPGMDRSELEDYVCDEHKRDLIMTKRVKPERHTIKPGQSLLLGGGLVRISAVNPNDTIMAASFVPLESHVTKTEKAIEMQTEQRTYPGKILMKEGTGGSITSAGKFDLKWDITNSNLPTSVAKAIKDKGIPVPALPYKVMAADILIEGCGWIELSIQIRNKRNSEEEMMSPQVEIFTPQGEFIGQRRPIECWNFMAEKLKADKRKRPRTRHRYS